jgi:hypothetical protein
MTTLLTGLHGPSGRLLLVRLLDAGHVTGSATQADPGARVFSAHGSIPPIRARRLGQQPAATCSGNQGTNGWIMTPEVHQAAVRCRRTTSR